MVTKVHFIDVGQGNMVLIEADNGGIYFFDCNITDENEDDVLQYVANQIDWYSEINAFICSHRDADHVRGIRKLHAYFPIQSIWDSNYPGTSTTSTEYQQYMALRRTVGCRVITKKTRNDFGHTRFRYLSAADDRLAHNANAQGIVLKVEHLENGNSSAMLPGDSDAETWRAAIMKDYAAAELSSSILMAGHHGSDSFFDDPQDEEYYFTRHVQAVSPAMTIVSVGPNQHGHPAANAMKFYSDNSSGSRQGNKVFRTDKQGNIVLELRPNGAWNLKVRQ